MRLLFIFRIIGRFGRQLCRYRGMRFADGIETLCDTFHRALNNVDFSMESNGELRVLRIMSELQPTVIFDVGANRGEWSQLVSEMSPSCAIHAFEIVPSTFAELLRSTRHLNNIVQIDHGLSNKEEMISISLGRDSSTATGCKIKGMQYHNEYYSNEIQCSVRKASDYMREKEIDFIDFVKIDVEGMDLKVIQGFEEALQNVRALQFEYGIFNIASHDLLADFCRYLNEKGFVIGKIFPRHVVFFEYHFHMENFHGSNYVAVKVGEKNLIDKLAGYGA